MDIVISRPIADEYPQWFAAEIEIVHYNDLFAGLRDINNITIPLLKSLTTEDLAYRYAPGKWSIKQMWQHVIDVERVLSYRALRFARMDDTILNAFDENKYAEASKADARSFPDMLHEFSMVRMSTIELFKSFTAAMFLHQGTAGRSKMTVRALGYLILGHEIHHIKIIRERYLKQ